MAGSLTALTLQQVAAVLQNATGAPVSPPFSTEIFINLYHTTLTDAVIISTTGRLGDDYQSTQLSNTTSLWTLAGTTSPSSFNNKVVITITTAAASTGTVKAFTIQDTSSTAAGNILAWGDVTPNQVVSTGNTVQFSTGALSVTIGGTTGGVAT